MPNFWHSDIHCTYSQNTMNLVDFAQKSCFLGPTIFQILQTKWHACWHVIVDVSSSYYLLQTWLKMHFLYTGFQTHFAHKSLYGFGVSKCDKIHYFFKQCLRNLHFCKTRYFSRNLSISCSIQVPYFDKVKIVHNTVLKVNGLHNLKHFVCTLMGRVPACRYQIHYIWVMWWAISISAKHNTRIWVGTDLYFQKNLRL